MWWIPVLAWCGALVVALVVLGFCAYEITWKSARLRTDLRRLDSVQRDLARVGAQLAGATARMAQAAQRARLDATTATRPGP